MALRFNLGAYFLEAATDSILNAKRGGFVSEGVAAEAIRVIAETAEKLRSLQLQSGTQVRSIPLVRCRRWGIRSIAQPGTWLMTRDGDGKVGPFATDLSLDCEAKIRMIGGNACEFWETAEMSDEEYARLTGARK